DPGDLARLVMDRDQRIAARARRLLVRLSGPDEDELSDVVDGGGGPDRHAGAGRRVVLGRVDAPSLLARVHVQADDAAAERVVGLLDPLLERRDADDDGVAGEDGRRVDAEERLRIEHGGPDDGTGVTSERVERPVALRDVDPITGDERRGPDRRAQLT